MVRTIVCVCLLSFCVAAMVSAQDPKARGEKIFAERKCGRCHSIAGNGNMDGPLDDIGARLPADEIREWITDPKAVIARTASQFRKHRKPDMEQYTLPKEEIDALVRYLSSLKKNSQ